MNDNILQIFLYELRRNFRRKGYLFATFGLPTLIFVAMMGYQLITGLNSDDEADAATQADQIAELFDFEGIQAAGYVDLSGTFGTVPENMQERVTRYDSVDAARADMQDDAVDVFYVIDADYLQNQEITLHLPGLALSFLNPAPIEQLIYATLADDLDVATLSRLRNTANIQEINLQRAADGQAANEEADFAMIYGFSIIFLLGMFLTNNYLLQSVIEEKENRLVEILLSSVTPTQLLTGKILAMSVLGITQIVVWVVAAVIMLNISIQLSAFESVPLLQNIQLPLDMLPLLFVYFLLGYLFYAAVNGAVGALTNSMREGPGYAVLFLLPMALPYYFFPLFAETPNAALPVALSIIPITAPLAMTMRLAITTVPFAQVLLSLALLSVVVVFMFWAAGRLFRVQTLLAGQTPKLREIPRLLRG